MYKTIKEIAESLKRAIKEKNFTVKNMEFSPTGCKIRGEMWFGDEIKYYFVAEKDSFIFYGMGPDPFVQFTLNDDEKKDILLYMWKFAQEDIEKQYQCDVRMIERIVKELE